MQNNPEEGIVNLRESEYLGKKRIVKKLGNVIVSDVQYDPSVSTEWHYHEHSLLSLVVKGGSRERRKNVDIQSDITKVLCYNPGLLHQNTDTIFPTRNLFIEVKKPFFEQYQLQNREFPNAFSFENTVRFIFLKIVKESQDNDELSVLGIESMLLNLISCLQNIEGSELKKPSWVKTVMELLHDRWNENMSLDEIAKICGVHPVTVSKNFQRYFCSNMSEYIRKIRIEKALTMMQKSETNLTEIAYECGFYDQSHFIKNFKEFTGFSPRQLKHL
jgi:AraC family transcriptional regulator